MSVETTVELPAVQEPQPEPRDLFPPECLVWRSNEPCPRMTDQTCECPE